MQYSAWLCTKGAIQLGPIERHEFNTSHYGDFKGDTVQSRHNITDRLNAQKLEVEVENGVGRVAG